MSAGAAVSAAGRTHRLIVGLVILVLVNFLWVGSAELTKYIFVGENFDRPFFTTYVKTCMFSIYLLGFLFHRSWRDMLCLDGAELELSDVEYHELRQMPTSLSEPSFEPIHECSGDEANMRPTVPPDPEPPDAESRAVRFARIHEVRMMPDVLRTAQTWYLKIAATEAREATLARLPYELWLRAVRLAQRRKKRLPLKAHALLALQFCFVWFAGNYGYQAALSATHPTIVNVLSTTSSLFTLILSAVLPANTTDRFSLSKLCLVLISGAGVVLVSCVDGDIEKSDFGSVPKGVVWTLIGAMCYAIYLVLLRRKIDNEDKIDIPLFFGLVGICCAVTLWPALWLAHVSGAESFYPLPTRSQFACVLLNGILGTVLSEYLWLWGCLLTSSLLATLSLSLGVPMTVIADAVIWQDHYPWSFYAGAVPIIAAFVGTALVTQSESDPVLIVIRRVVQKITSIVLPASWRAAKKRRTSSGDSGRDSEAAQSLIAMDEMAFADRDA